MRREIVDRAAGSQQALVAHTFVEWSDVLAMQVLDDGGFVCCGIIEFQNAARDRGAPCELRGSQTARPGHQHEALAVGSNENRLEHAVTTHTGGEFFETRFRK